MKRTRHNGRRAPVEVQRCETIRAASAGRRSAAAGARLFLLAPANSMSFLGCREWLGAAPKASRRQWLQACIDRTSSGTSALVGVRAVLRGKEGWKTGFVAAL